MPGKHTVKLRITSKTAPVVALTGEGSAAYVYFNRDAKYARTITQSEWPVLAIDVAEDGTVIGVESIGFRDITLTAILKRAGLKLPGSLANRAQYVVEETPAFA